MKKVLIISCIIIVTLSSIVLANLWMNVSNNNTKNFTIKFNSKPGSEFNKVVETALADPEVRKKIEALEKKSGNISAVISESDNLVEVRFAPDFDPHEERKEKEELYGILCVIDIKAKKVVKVEEFDIPPISVPTHPPLNPPFWELRLYLNNDTEEFVHEFVRGEEIRIFLENIGNETITLPNPAPWEVKVLPMIDAEIESKLHCSPEETVYAKFPKIYPDMYNITNALIYKPEVQQTAVLIHPNETITWTWDQRLEDGSLLKPGHYHVVLRGPDVKCVEQTIFYVLPEQ